jgi:indolepyruvate ferredoxin oxidoreductase
MSSEPFSDSVPHVRTPLADDGKTATSPPYATYSLEDKWTLAPGRTLLSGNQAIALVLLAQAAIDRRNNLNTAGYVSGYRGSPLGTLDSTLSSIRRRLAQANIVFQPGVNEDIAASAARGTQQLDLVPNPKFDGVFAAWYGKGPGVDRSCDALKHGNYAGAHPKGGVALFYGDDHLGKSSTVAHQSEQALAACLIPSFYPANVQELFDFGLLAYAASRYSGAWIGVKCVGDVVEQSMTVNVDLESYSPIVPPEEPGTPNVHIGRGAYNPLREETIALESRLPRVHRFVRANGLDKTVFRAAVPRLGIITAGKAYGDVRSALALLGLTDQRAAAAGISLYKVGCIWPLEPEGLTAFARGHHTLLVIEEKKSLLEQQAAGILINLADRPLLLGKRDESGVSLVSSSQALDAVNLARIIANRLSVLGAGTDAIRSAVELLGTHAEGPGAFDGPKRAPYFCSGCPHNRSTRIPEGSLSMTGIGCHTMVNFVRPEEALLPGQMGGEGANWIGLAPFTGTRHMFQNMGDGTYYHSGLLAIRAAVAAGVNITYKILYNDAVAMTGGQAVDGPISVVAIARQIADEGVARICIVSDQPDRHENAVGMPEGVTVHHRDELDAVQRVFREVPGCSAIIYEQTCAAEKRRRRKRGRYPDPPKRLFISHAVCEGCGDCSAQSTCVSLLPRETELGRKRQIDQSGCNKDYSCLNGFCPSFITVYGAEPQKKRAASLDDALFAQLRVPAPAVVGSQPVNILLSGIGGTGVVTVSALLATAAHLSGLAASAFDQTGLAQKNGAVNSHLRIARQPGDLTAQRLGAGETDVLLAFDVVAALSADAAPSLSPTRTRAVVNRAVSPTSAFQFDRDSKIDSSALIRGIEDRARPNGTFSLDAVGLAGTLLGDTIGANLILLGYALQRGLLPIGLDAIEQAVRLNNVAVDSNLRALRLGRLCAERPALLEELAGAGSGSDDPHAMGLEATLAHRVKHLTEYQNEALARRYLQLIERVREKESARAPGSSALTLAVARSYAKLLAYKDEYEVARLLTSASLQGELADTFGSGARIAYNLAPPFLGGKPVAGRPRKREFGRWIFPLLRLLAASRAIRGTALDPFGRTRERKAERQLIADYERLIAEILGGLQTHNHSVAVELAQAAQEIKGFGPVKETSLHAYQSNIGILRRRFLASPPRSRQEGREVVGEFQQPAA